MSGVALRFQVSACLSAALDALDVGQG